MVGTRKGGADFFERDQKIFPLSGTIIYYFLSGFFICALF